MSDEVPTIVAAHALKSFRLYVLDQQIEAQHLPWALNKTSFPRPDDVLKLVRQFNETLTRGIPNDNQQPGQWRNGRVVLNRSDHTPPPPMEVPGLMENYAEQIAEKWRTTDIVHIHAHALWRLNWIHPFFNGNGRTSRAFSYFLVCVKFGKLLPGPFTITAQIQHQKEEHYQALREADQGNLGRLESQSRRYLRNQLRAAVGEAAN